MRIAYPSGDTDSWPYFEDVKKANAYIEELPPPAADIKNKDLHKLVAELIQQRRQQHYNPNYEATYTLRELDHCYVMRQERRRHRRDREVEAINYGTVFNYTSSRAVRDTRFAAERNDRLLSKKYLKLSSDKFIPLNEVVQRSREHHTYATLHRLSALAEIMTINGWQASFTVQTVPSRMHAKRTIKKGNKHILVPNPKFDGTMPDTAHAWANQKWANVGATLDQMGYEEGKDWMCIRTVEAHKDGTPHYNFVFVGSIIFLKKVNSIMREKYLYASDADGDEYGAEKRRVKVNYESGEVACRKIVSYAAKYALKNYLPEDMHKSTEHKLEHIRNLAWRQTWNIRAFSLGGFAAVGLWNECRNRHYEKTDINLVKYAVETNWTAFQKEFMLIKDDGEIKPFYIMRINKYKEEVKECIGHFIKKTNTIIAKRITRAVIVRNIFKAGGDAVIRLIVSEPSKSEAKSKPEIQATDPPPPT
ncbi:MAG: replication endonuclease [Mariprofundus sp.]|nr:replication endonuclease [Mariprofundus sp.]